MDKIIIKVEEGKKYIDDKLLWRGSLSLSLRDIIDNTETIYALAPLDTPLDALYNFSSGGIYYNETNRLFPDAKIKPIINKHTTFLIEIIKKYIFQSGDNCCILEDALSSPGDPILLKKKLNYISSDKDEVFYFFDSSNYDLVKLENSYTQAEQIDSLFVLSSFDKNRHIDLLNPNKLSKPDFDLISINTDLIVLKAYDGEGYLIWVKKTYDPEFVLNF